MAENRLKQRDKAEKAAEKAQKKAAERAQKKKRAATHLGGFYGS